MHKPFGRPGAPGRLLLIILLGALTFVSTAQGVRAIGPGWLATGTPAAATPVPSSPGDWPL